jgi:hypothetical protein
MNLKLIKLQALISGLLSLTLAAEWSYGEYTNSQLQQQPKPSDGDGAAPPRLPSITTLKSAAEEYGEMVERPLFIEGRKPLPEAGPTDKPQNVETGQIDDWLLIGVFNNGQKPPIAMFAKKNEAKKYLKIGTEQMISGWLLKEIQPDHVILEQAGQQKSVLLRKPRPESKLPVRGRPVPPSPPPAQQPNTNPENANDDSETN